MYSFKFGWKACAGVLCAICLCVSGRLFAQAAPPGPLHPTQPLPPVEQPPTPKKEPQVEPRKTIAGFWKFNADESDDPRRKMEDARGSGGGPVGGMGGPGRRPGIGYPFPGGPGNGPYGGPGGGGMGGEESDSERMRDLIRPADSLTINPKDPEVDLTDDQGNKLVIYTDGKKLQKSKGETVQTISAHWNGSQLITDEKSPQGRKMSRTLELSPDGRQFNETWRIETGRSDSSLTIRYVYDAASPDRR